MNRLLLVLRDTVAGQYMAPFVSPTLGVAYRQLADAVNRESTPDDPLVAHPEDFELFRLGVYDDETGLMTLEEKPRSVCKLSDLKTKPVSE